MLNIEVEVKTNAVFTSTFNIGYSTFFCFLLLYFLKINVFARFRLWSGLIIRRGFRTRRGIIL